MKTKENIISFSINPEINETWKDVSLLSIGEAKGHGMFVDIKSLETAFKVSVGKSIPAYNNHLNNPKVTDRIGFFSGQYVEPKEGKFKAAEFSFLDSYKEKFSEEYENLLEQKEKFPDAFGVSLNFKYSLVWVFEEDESEIEATKDYFNGVTAPNGAFTLPRVRFLKIMSADFVSNPATNEGLFSEKDEEKEKEILEDEKYLNNPTNVETEKIMLKEINNKFAEKPELLAEAIKFAAAGDEVESFEQVESHIEQFQIQLDLTNKDKEIESLKTQLSEKETELETKLSEKDQKINELTETLENLKGGEANFSTGEEEVIEESDIQKQYAAIEGFSERMEFYKAHKAELNK